MTTHKPHRTCLSPALGANPHEASGVVFAKSLKTLVS